MTIHRRTTAAAALLLGLALAWLREQLDNTLKTSEDIERTLGLVFLGLLPSFDGSGPWAVVGPEADLLAVYEAADDQRARPSVVIPHD